MNLLRSRHRENKSFIRNTKKLSTTNYIILPYIIIKYKIHLVHVFSLSHVGRPYIKKCAQVANATYKTEILFLLYTVSTYCHKHVPSFRQIDLSIHLQ